MIKKVKINVTISKNTTFRSDLKLSSPLKVIPVPVRKDYTSSSESFLPA